MTTTAEVLVDLLVAALRPNASAVPPKPAPTSAGARVEAYRAWPLQTPYEPHITIDLPEEAKEYAGGGPASFNTTAAITIRGYVCAASSSLSSSATDDGGEVRVRTALTQLRRQIELAVINDPAILKTIQRFDAVHTKMQASQDGNGYHLAELGMQLHLRFYQGPEDFAQPTAGELDLLHFDVQPPAQPGIDVPLDVSLT